MQCLATIAVETFRDSIHDVLEDRGCKKHGVLCSELNEYFKSSIRVKSECISAITTPTFHKRVYLNTTKLLTLKGHFHLSVNTNFSLLKCKYSEASGCDHLSSATSFLNYQKFPSQITILGTSCKQPHLVSDTTTFRAKSLKLSFVFYLL